MAPVPPGPLRTLAFGGPARWGAGWFPGPGGVLVLGDADGAEVVAAELEVESGTWRVRAAGTELTITGAGKPGPVVLGQAPERAGWEQRCTVTGGAAGGAAAGGGFAEAPGCRGERTDTGPLRDAESVRAISAWFGAEAAVGILAVRPGKGRGHATDLATAALVTSEGASEVAEARLSTTYTGAGRPTRMNAELWSADPDSPPRRLAGESTGSGATGIAAGWSVSVELLAAHLRGDEGSGVYLLGRPA